MNVYRVRYRFLGNVHDVRTKIIEAATRDAALTTIPRVHTIASVAVQCGALRADGEHRCKQFVILYVDGPEPTLDETRCPHHRAQS